MNDLDLWYSSSFMLIGLAVSKEYKFENVETE